MKTSLSSHQINFSVFSSIYYWSVAFWSGMLEVRRPEWMPRQEAKTEMANIKEQARQLQSQWQGAPRGGGGRGAAVAAAAPRGLREHPGRADRQPGRPAGAGRAQGHLPVGLAGGGGRQPVPTELPRPKPLPGQLGATGGTADQQRAAARGADHVLRGGQRR